MVDWNKWMLENKTADIDTTYDYFQEIIQNNIVFENKKINKKRVPICPYLSEFLNLHF